MAVSPLALPEYRRFLFARGATFMTGSGRVVALGYQLYDVARRLDGLSITQASFMLGLLGLVQFLPMFVLTPVAGVVADRYDRRHVAALALAVDMGISLSLAIATATHHVSLPLLFALGAAHGAARVFVGPAMGAMTARLVPAGLLPRAVAFNAIAMQFGMIGGPAVSGVLYGVSEAMPYGLNAAVLIACVAAVLSLGALPPNASSRDTHPIRPAAEGFSFVRANHFLLGCVTLDLFAVLLGGATALLPVYARDILHVGPIGLGQMRSATALGAAIVALVFAVRPLAHNVGVKMLWAVVVYGAATALFGVSRNYTLSLAALALVGAADMFSVFIRNSLVQLHTPDDKRGRVSAISGLAISASNELGEMESGLAASIMGATGAVVFGGIAAIVITALWAWAFPEIRRARTFAPPNAEQEQAHEG